MIATTLQCLSCGAAVAKPVPNCGHCGARVRTRSCPGCFGMMSSDSRYCPHCGAAAEAWESSETTLRCPTCTLNLRAGTLGNARLHECPKCSGVWLDPATLERLSRDADQQAVLLAGAPASGVTACPGFQSPHFTVRARSAAS